MCPNDTPSLYQPLVNRLFDSEAGSDVTFLVGHEPETWRFPGHRWVLSEANPVFRAMLAKRGDVSPEEVIPVTDVDGKAFDILLRHMYKEDVVIQSVSTALSTLYAAHKYLCPGLMKLCIIYLDSHLDVTNVLQIFEHIRVYSGQTNSASAPPLEHIDVIPDSNLESMLVLSRSLLHNCLLFIDTHAEEILVQESVEDMRKEALQEIVDRDTLCASEFLVYAAIERWCKLEGKRFHLELNRDNLRSVLGDDLLFSVRYLLMSRQEFFEGPMKGDLLDKQETTTLYGLMNGLSVSVDSFSEDRLRRFRTKRRPPKVSRIPLTKGSSTESKRKVKEKKKEKEESPGRCTGSCVADYVVRALACIFD